jgi:hypothetical protein
MEAFCILDRAGCGLLSLVAAAELDEFDAIGEGMAEPVGKDAQRMAVA